MLADPVPVVPGGAADQVDQPLVGLLGLAAEHLDVGREQLGVQVVGRRRWPRRSRPRGPPRSTRRSSLTWARPGLGGTVGRRLGEDLLVRPLGGVQIAADQRLVRLGQARVLAVGQRSTPAALSTASIHWRSCASGTTPVNASIGWPPTTAYTIGMPCTRNIWASRGLASTSTLASTQAPPPSTASFSSTGESCLQGPHHSAQKSTTTGVVSERSSTSDWKVASVTSMTVTPPAHRRASRSPRRPAAGATTRPPEPPGWSAAGRSRPDRSSRWRLTERAEVYRAAGKDRLPVTWVAHSVLVSHARR